MLFCVFTARNPNAKLTRLGSHGSWAELPMHLGKVCKKAALCTHGRSSGLDSFFHPGRLCFRGGGQLRPGGRTAVMLGGVEKQATTSS